MFHIIVPHKFWSDAVLAACVLINRLPSTVLSGQTPYSVLCLNHKAFPLPPKIFGCVCFVHNILGLPNKFSPRATNCIFLGYSKTQKGYRCFDLVSGKYCVSADVTFFESTPFYSPESSSSDFPPTPMPIPLPLPVKSLDFPLLQVYTRRKV